MPSFTSPSCQETYHCSLCAAPWCQGCSAWVHQSEGRTSSCFLITEDMPGRRFPLSPSSLDGEWWFLVKSVERDFSGLPNLQVRTEIVDCQNHTSEQFSWQEKCQTAAMVFLYSYYRQLYIFCKLECYHRCLWEYLLTSSLLMKTSLCKNTNAGTFKYTRQIDKWCSWWATPYTVLLQIVASIQLLIILHIMLLLKSGICWNERKHPKTLTSELPPPTIYFLTPSSSLKQRSSWVARECLFHDYSAISRPPLLATHYWAWDNFLIAYSLCSQWAYGNYCLVLDWAVERLKCAI